MKPTDEHLTDEDIFGVPGYDENPEGREEKMAETITCKECGKTEELHWGPHNEKLKARSLCFSCDHWTDYAENDASNPNAVVIEGKHYMVCDESQGGKSTSGFYGQKFIIEKFTGERIVTTNLWHQGTIPEHFRERLPDNARFVR